MTLVNLPDDVLEKILSYITYDEVSRNRIVCRRMNYVCKRVLNRGFHKVERYHSQCLRRVKTQLPRRESERRKHPLARHCDILTAVETRLSLLGMTFMKFMELNLCCFIPGKVLDEIYRVLRYVTSEQSPVRAHEVLQELRDLSSMAMEHFDEKISPAFRKCKESNPKIITGISILSPSVSFHAKATASRSGTGERRGHRLRDELRSVSQRQNATARDVTSLKQKLNETQNTNKDLEKKVLELQNLLSTQIEKMKEQDLKIEVLTCMSGSSAILKPSALKEADVTAATTASMISSSEHKSGTSKIEMPTKTWPLRSKRKKCAPRNDRPVKSLKK